jgi:hypothetical protein
MLERTFVNRVLVDLAMALFGRYLVASFTHTGAFFVAPAAVNSSCIIYLKSAWILTTVALATSHVSALHTPGRTFRSQ